MGRSDLWYKNAIIYGLDVETFFDSDGDGIGDFPGLTAQLDYLASVGATCLWVLPFYPTPNRDNGYDVTDHYSIDPRLGSLGDFVEFTREARDRGMRVIIDLVVNHTSDQHPWFTAAKNPESPFRSYYIWSESPPQDTDVKIIFPGVEESPWQYDEEAGAYYWHRFYKFEPDLNTMNPAVQAEILKLMGFWLELGVSGFRIDAAPYMVQAKGTQPAPEDPHRWLREMRDFVLARHGDAILIAEADVEPERLASFFGHGDEMHLLFNFLVNNYLYLAFARESAEPLIRGLELLPETPRVGQWANFVRNQDELDLERLTEQERQEVYAAFGPEETMRIYGRGIRRRLPPMVGGDRRRMELAYSLLFTLPGTPVFQYGEEIGMGDDLSLPGRNSVRTVMQWSGEPNGGFSAAPKQALVRPVIGSGRYGYKAVNVARQRPDPNSFFNWFARIIRARRQAPAFGWGSWRIIDADAPAILAHRSEWEGRAVLAVHNFSSQPCEPRLDLNPDEFSSKMELVRDQDYGPLDPQSSQLPLGPYGYRWFRIGGMRQ